LKTVLKNPLIQLGFLLFLLIPIQTFCQKKVSRISQQWIQSYHEAKLTTRWTALLDGGFRWREGFAEPSAYIIRGGIAYSILPNLRAASGFAHLGFFANEKVIRQEFRPHQEIQYRYSIGKVNFSQRIRIEERFFKAKAVITPFSELDFNFRFRYQFMVAIPLFRLAERNPDRKLILNLGDELFLNAGKQVANQVFDLNRLLISPSIQWSKSLSIALTYNSQYASTSIPDRYIHSNVAWLQLRHNLDFRKSED